MAWTQAGVRAEASAPCTGDLTSHADTPLLCPELAIVVDGLLWPWGHWAACSPRVFGPFRF